MSNSTLEDPNNYITCIFDYDDTLRFVRSGQPAPESADVVSACGVDYIGLASASAYESYKRAFLLKHYPDQFGPVVDTPAFQNG